MKSNPYIAGNPVGGEEAFIGRHDVLRDVLRILKSSHENGMVLYGQRRIGKTSVLLELAANLPQQGPYAPVYFDLQDKAALPIEEVLCELADRIVYHLHIPEVENEKDDFVTDFKQDFLPYVLSQLAEDVALVLLFDEFDVMDTSGNQAGSAFFPYLRELMSLNTKRLKFVFVIGRRPEDLSSLTLSVFKGVKYRHVSLLSKEDTANLVYLAEKNESLKWHDEAIEKVFAMSGGHPFLTQQLCQVLWESIYDEEPEDVPVVKVDALDQIVPDALRSATNSLEWLWDGLQPAQRVVASALAEAGPGIITQERLEQCLQESGVRILIGELQDAPKTLADWDLIRPEDGGYRIPAEMLRLWIVERKPLSRVQDEIDRIEPVANSLFQAAYGLYQGERFKEAIPLLRQAIALNPNHLKANQLLAEILLAQGALSEARELLEKLYNSNPAVARPRLLQVLFILAQETEKEEYKCRLYERILELSPNHPEILSEYRAIYEKRGDAAYQDNNLDRALDAYKKADATGKLKKVEKELRLNTLYLEALDALENNDKYKAQALLAEVLSVKPAFREATRYMHLAVTGVDVATLTTLADEHKKLQHQVEQLNATKKRIQRYGISFFIVIVVGLLAAIAIPNVLTAIQRSKRSRTAADMRALGTALGSYCVDFNHFPIASGIWSNDLMPNGYYDGVEKDAWGTPFNYSCEGYGCWEDTYYTLKSYGKDTKEGCESSEFDSDIIFANGQFTSPQALVAR